MKSCDQDFCFVASRRAETEGLERFEYIVAVSVINLLLFVVEKGSSCRIFQQPVKLNDTLDGEGTDGILMLGDHHDNVQGILVLNDGKGTDRVGLFRIAIGGLVAYLRHLMSADGFIEPIDDHGLLAVVLDPFARRIEVAFPIERRTTKAIGESVPNGLLCQGR